MLEVKRRFNSRLVSEWWCGMTAKRFKIDRFEVATYKPRYADSSKNKIALIIDKFTDDIVCEIKLYETLEENKALGEKIKLIIEENEVCEQAYQEVKSDAIRLKNENEQLKSQLRIYRRIASCSNCDYHDYDEFENSDGSYDEFEVCRKGNDVTERICADWREL